MNSSTLSTIKKNWPKTLLYSIILVFGIFFIIDSAIILEIGFYVAGGVIIATSIVILIKLLVENNRQNRRVSFLRLFFIVMSLVGGVSIIIYSNQGISFYQEVLASIFFFRSLYRFFYAYLSNKTGQRTKAIVFLTLAIIGLALSAFLSFYTDSSKVVGIVAGIAVILEGIYGLYRIWSPLVLNKAKVDLGGKNNNNYSENNRTSPPNANRNASQSDEIIITDYEIVETDETDNSKNQ